MKRVWIVGLVLVVLCNLALALTCPKCAKPVPDGSKFCPECGQKFQFRCPKCKKDVQHGGKFCPHCGTKLTWPGAKPKPGPKPAPGATPMDSSEIFAKASPAVVRIAVKDKTGRQVGTGSGFLISADGYVVTNYHVIRKAWSATVVTSDKKKMPVLGYAGVVPEHDLALIRVNGKGLPFLAIAPGDRPKVGTKVCAIGYPLGLPCTLSEGIVSGQPKLPIAGKPIELIQTTAAISPGSSGGPLLTGYGRVLVQGVTSGTVLQGQSLNMVLPAKLVRDLLGKKGTIRRLPPPQANLPTPPTPAEPGPKYERKFTDPFDQEVQKGIDRAVEYLWSTRKEDGSWEPVGLQIGKDVMKFPVGPTALVCYALLESGIGPQDKRMAKSLRWLARQESNKKTYTLALRANVWLAASRTDAKYRKDLAEDVKRLVKGTTNGSYSYDCPTGNLVGDNSNSQYGLLGVWAGTKAHLEDIPKQYWDVVARHWKKAQNPDGGWGYHKTHRTKSYPSMAVAGLASLFVCNDNLQADKFADCGANATVPPIEKGLAWLEATIRKIGLDSTLEVPGANVGRMRLDMYYLFGVERVALASGYKYFGHLPWYQAGATRILKYQQPNGAVRGQGFGDVNTATAYALLFLARGRHPVVFNKLKFDSDWNNRPRDLAVLTRWLSTTFERTLNWQIIALDNPVEQWHDAPILYVSGSKDPRFSPKHLETLRTFVHQGGTIFSCTECGGAGFKTKMREAYAKMFPRYKLQPLDPKHDLFRVHFKVRGLQFSMLTNGVRPLAIHCDFDLPLGWQQRRFKTRTWTFQVAANIAMYVTGKGAFRPRGITHWPPDKAPAPTKTVPLVRLKHGGNFNPEPLAFERFRRLLAQRNKIKIEVLGPVAIGALARSGAKLAALTGTGTLSLSAEEKKALKDFVAGGGTLVIDAAGGNAVFDKSARAILSEMYGARLRTLATVSSLFKQKGMEIKRVRYRGAARMRLGRSSAPSLRAITLADRPAVIYSREDITSGLVGYESATCDGYDVDSAFEIMRNIVNLAG